MKERIEMKKRHKAEEIIKILRDIEAGGTVVEGIKKHGISDATYYKWRKQYRGMNVDEAKRLKELQTENTELKKLVADQALMIHGLKVVNKKKW